jgi:hypothetical protein
MVKSKKKPFPLNSAAKLVKRHKKCKEGNKKQPENRTETAQHNLEAFPL